MIYVYIKDDIIKLSKRDLYLYDVCKIYGDEKIDNVFIKKIEDDLSNYVLCVIDIVKILVESYPEQKFHFINNNDVCIQIIKDKKTNKILEYIKVFFVISIIFFGSATAIMAFHIESNMGGLAEYYGDFLGITKNQIKYGFGISYSLGVFVGIVVFFNHFNNKKITNDPTPLEIELVEYEDKVKSTINNNVKKQIDNNEV